MKILIVNADDFGRTPGVNAGVLEAHGGGIVTSATVMVLEKAAARGIREASERAPRLSLGLHFCVTGGGPPAAPARALPTLAPGGRFRRVPEELPAEIPAAEVRAELEAQIALFQMLAREDPSHLLAAPLKAEPAAGAAERLSAAIKGRERAAVVGREAYLVYPDGIGRSALTMPVVERALGVRATGRNWNTVMKLAAMLDG